MLSKSNVPKSVIVGLLAGVALTGDRRRCAASSIPIFFCRGFESSACSSRSCRATFCDF
jgi:hypothetical protein